MAENKNLTTVTTGVHDGIEFEFTHVMNSGRLVMRVSRDASLVFWDAGALRHMAEQMTEAANEWERMEANDAWPLGTHNPDASDPELERLLAEEEEIERQVNG